MNAKEFQKLLKELNACPNARMWARRKTLRKVWATCHRGDWMYWLVSSIHWMSKNKKLRKLWPSKRLAAAHTYDSIELRAEAARYYPNFPANMKGVTAARLLGRKLTGGRR